MKTKVLGKLERVLHRGFIYQRAWSPGPSVYLDSVCVEGAGHITRGQERACPLPSATPLSQPTPLYLPPIPSSSQDLFQVVECWEEFPTVSQAWSPPHITRRPLFLVCPAWHVLPTWFMYSTISQRSFLGIPALIDPSSSHLSPCAVFLIINDGFVC